MTATREFLDREYNPRVRIPHYADFFARWKTRAHAARESLTARLDVAYGSSPNEKLDYFPASATDAPLLIFIHGGYWRSMDKADFSWIAPAYVAAGISVAIPNYGLAPATTVGAIVWQMQGACAWTYDHAEDLGVNRRRLFCAGHSAGGHLTAMMLTTQWSALSPRLPSRLLAGALTVSGLFDLVPLTQAEFLNQDLALDEAGARALSPASLTLHDHAPLLRAVGALESDEFHRQSNLIAQRWPSVCGTALIDVPGCDHLSVCDALATPGNVLFETAREAIERVSVS